MTKSGTRAFVRQKTYFAVLKLLNSISADKKYPDVLLGELFKKDDFSSNEKAVIVSLVYGILRNRGRLDYIIENASCAKIPVLDLDILNILRICTHQAVFLNISPAGILNNAVALTSKENNFTGFVKRTAEGILRNKDAVAFPDKEKATVEYISTYHSHPTWIVEKWLREFKEPCEVEALCSANNLEPPLTIRVNLLKTDRENLRSQLESDGYLSSPTPFSPVGLIVDKKEDIFKTEAFKNGLFEVQDEGSQLIALLAGAKPGELVIDACAGSGGKSLLLSGLMRNKGTVIASETSASKLEKLRRRAARSGALNIRTVRTDGLREFHRRADFVLIDAPCSGMGVFRRNPDSKWRLTQGDIEELAVKQKGILQEYSRLVKPGGRLVYATCTISREENEDVVRGFLDDGADFQLIPASEMNPEIFSQFMNDEGFFRSLPHIHHTDGFFGAVMRRQG